MGGKLEINNEDCLNAMKNIKVNSVDLLINCAFPYYNTVGVASSILNKKFIGFQVNEEYLKEFQRILKK